MRVCLAEDSPGHGSASCLVLSISLSLSLSLSDVQVCVDIVDGRVWHGATFDLKRPLSVSDRLSGQSWPKFRPNLGATLAELGPMSVECCPNLRQTVGQSWLSSTEPDSAEIVRMFGRIRVDFGRHRARFGRSCPDLAEVWASIAQKGGLKPTRVAQSRRFPRAGRAHTRHACVRTRGAHCLGESMREHLGRGAIVLNTRRRRRATATESSVFGTASTFGRGVSREGAMRQARVRARKRSSRFSRSGRQTAGGTVAKAAPSCSLRPKLEQNRQIGGQISTNWRATAEQYSSWNPG